MLRFYFDPRRYAAHVCDRRAEPHLGDDDELQGFLGAGGDGGKLGRGGGPHHFEVIRLPSRIGQLDRLRGAALVVFVVVCAVVR